MFTKMERTGVPTTPPQKRNLLFPVFLILVLVGFLLMTSVPSLKKNSSTFRQIQIKRAFLPLYPKSALSKKTKQAVVKGIEPTQKRVLLRATPKKQAKLQPGDLLVATESIPFEIPLLQIEKRYKKTLKKALAMKIGRAEKEYLKNFYHQRINEASRKRVDLGLLSLSASRYLSRKGILSFRLLGFRQLAEFEKELSSWIKKGGSFQPVELRSLLKKIKFYKVARYVGDLSALFGVVGTRFNQKKLSRLQRFWFRTLFIVRWTRTARGHYPLPVSLQKPFYIDYLYARINFSKKHENRMWAAQELSKYQKDFPLFRTFGWLFLRKKERKTSILFLKRAIEANPKDELSKKLLDKIMKTKP